MPHGFVRLGFMAVGLGLLGSGPGVSLVDGASRPRIIRPPDDRTDYFASSAMLRGIGDSVCAFIAADMITDNGDGTFTINPGTLAEQFNPLCAGERFADQPTAANCTATLIAPDILVTAGHCLDEKGVRTAFDTFYFVFDYAVREAGVNPSTFTTNQVYRGTEVLGLVNEENTANDWAVVKLDRVVTGRTPVAVRSSGSVTVGESVVAIGFGAGLPMKFSGNATVQGLVENGFEADLDIVAGNSGGPIVDATTGMIEGVLSSDLDVEDYHQAGACFRATVCPGDAICTEGFTSLASVMISQFQSTIQTALGTSGTGGAGDGTGDGATADNDADGDGVIDANDRCANTPADTVVDENGCEINDGGAGGNGGGVARSPCGGLGMIPLMLTMLGLAWMRRE